MLPILIDKYSDCSYDDLLNFIVSDSKHNCLLEEDSRHVFKKIKTLLENDGIEGFEYFNKWIDKVQKNNLPLELIWEFHKANLILATTYFYVNNPYCNNFYQLFEELYSESHEAVDIRAAKIICSVTAVLINTLKHSNDTLQLFVEEIIDNLNIKIIGFLENNTLKRSLIVDMKCYSDIKEDCLKEFAYLHLKHLLSLPSQYSVPGVVEFHTKRWTSNVLPSMLTNHIKEMLSVIPVMEVIDEINERVNESNLNWKYTFIIISVLVKNSDGAMIVKGAVDAWLRQSFEGEQMSSLYLPVLLARHCCYEKARYFQSYANWFTSINFKNSKYFSLFFSFLTEILPYEPPLYLKIHINKVPSAPHGKQSLLVDYIVLAKTRLTDLNESGEYIGLFSDYHETDETGQQADIARVISHYIETKEIAKPLLEAYVLRRQYYEKVFLKQLLKVSERNDTDRAQVIHRLYAMGKIPNYLYNGWIKLEQVGD